MLHTALKPAGMPRFVFIALVVGWILIAVKCLIAPAVMAHWQIPVHPSWVIVPTLLFAALITVLAWTHDWVHDEEE
ncbi:MAG TPA: hypothetical protein VGA56_10250 [Opitutaceae bacterium]